MDQAKPGQSVQFKGLKSSGHLNGTYGRLVHFLKKEQRWSVRVRSNNDNNVKNPNSNNNNNINTQMVKAKTENLILVEEHNVEHANADWAKGLSKPDAYEWLCNCYQLRCEDDYAVGGGKTHGPYDPFASLQSLVDDFLVFCVLAKRAQAFPQNWDWFNFFKVAPRFVVCAFEKCDAIERWGRENYFDGSSGRGRSLRYTAHLIYKSRADEWEDGEEHVALEQEVESDRLRLMKQVGGLDAWEVLVEDLGSCSRFEGMEEIESMDSMDSMESMESMMSNTNMW